MNALCCQAELSSTGVCALATNALATNTSSTALPLSPPPRANAEMSTLGADLRRSVDDVVWATFARAFEKAAAFYDDDKMAECVEECCLILAESASLPRYNRIRTPSCSRSS